MKRWLSIPTIVALAVGTTLLGTVTPASSQVSFADAVFSGYSTGTAVHYTLGKIGDTGPIVNNYEQSFSGASVASKGTNTLPGQGPGAQGGVIVNEMDQTVQPKLPGTGKLTGDRSFARGSGLEVGIAEEVPVELPTLPVNLAQTSSPPRNEDIKETGKVALDPVAYATNLRGEARSDWNNDTCILGKPISQGVGFTANAQLLNSGTGGTNPDGSLKQPLSTLDASDPQRAQVQSMSQTVVVPQVGEPNKETGAPGASLGSSFGLGAETRQTLSPITLFKGQPNETTIEVGGEWVLQAVAGGVPGSAWVRYAPEDQPDASTPVIRVFQLVPDPADPTGTVKDDLIEPINLQDLVGDAGLTVPLPGLGTIAIGERPRAIGSDDAATPVPPEIRGDGTAASAAVDVVRLTLLPDLGGYDIRVGHMESKVQVPAGGFKCPLPVNKDANPREVNAGERFTYTIEVVNPFDCVLDPVKVVDTISVDPGIKYTIQGSNPPASSTTGNSVTFDNVGPIAPRTSKTITIDVEVAADSAGGLFTNKAEVSATCASGSGEGLAKIRVPVSGLAIVQIPRVNAVAAALAATGRPSWLLPAAGLVLVVGFGGIVGIRRLRAT